MTFPQNSLNQQLAERIFLNRLEECVRFPKYFEVETVNACNARCTMCTIDDWESGGSLVMSMELIDKLAKEIAPHADWVEQICLNRDGEPTLDKQLPERVRRLKQAGARKVTFATNGQLLTEPLVVELCEAGLDDIMVSIDGSTNETFERIRVRLDFDVVVANTLRLIELRNQLRPDMTVRVRAVVLPENQHEIREIICYWKDKLSERDNVYAMPMHSWGNQHFQETEDKIRYYADKPCVSPFSTMVLDVAGRVPLCGCDYNAKLLLGDFSRNTIEQIWHDEPYTHARKLHATGKRNDIELCRGCDVWDRSLVGVKHDTDRSAPGHVPNDLQQSLIQIQDDLSRTETGS